MGYYHCRFHNISRSKYTTIIVSNVLLAYEIPHVCLVNMYSSMLNHPSLQLSLPLNYVLCLLQHFVRLNHLSK